MYNGYDATLVDVRGAKKLGIEHVRDKMVGRGVLLDVARFKGVNSLDDGYGVTIADLNACAAAQKVEVRKGDFVIVRTGHQERCLAEEGLERLRWRQCAGLCVRDLLLAARERRRRDLLGHLGL